MYLVGLNAEQTEGGTVVVTEIGLITCDQEAKSLQTAIARSVQMKRLLLDYALLVQSCDPAISAANHVVNDKRRYQLPSVCDPAAWTWMC